MGASRRRALLCYPDLSDLKFGV